MKDSAIQWTDHTFNAWEGCTKVAPECKNCYAETLVDHRFGRAKWGKGQPRRRTSAQLWKQPLKWNQNLIANESVTVVNAVCIEPQKLRRQRVFCLSLGDWLDEEVPLEWFVNLLEVIHATPNLDWQLLTKRSQNWQERTFDAFQFAMDNGANAGRQMDFTDWLGAWTHAHIAPSNVWIGVSAGADQKAALEIPAKVHFLSCEPMLHALDEEQNQITQQFDWIIFGGESGNNARPCSIDWIQRGVEMCRFYGIAPFVKQLGAVPVTENANLFDWPESAELHAGKPSDEGFAFAYIKLRDSHGGDMSEWPEDLRVREFPKVEVAA